MWGLCGPCGGSTSGHRPRPGGAAAPEWRLSPRARGWKRFSSECLLPSHTKSPESEKQRDTLDPGTAVHRPPRLQLAWGGRDPLLRTLQPPRTPLAVVTAFGDLASVSEGQFVLPWLPPVFPFALSEAA